MIDLEGLWGNTVESKLSESQVYLRTVSPLGAPLTKEQSEIYKALLIKEGVHITDTDDLLEALEKRSPK
ncbi:MAG: hypothetical protein PHX61_03470 [Alphaproteobacteria bacterium]|nr:hypothetical protein [Alphaproteobacteria bacterium]OIN87501.1 MAG: hypothetical protein AUJ12_01875 [Alphaproteobacteria bacterium CG1_02_46_17]